MSAEKHHADIEVVVVKADPVNTSRGVLLEDAEDLLIAQLPEVLVRAADRDEWLRSPQTDDAVCD